MSHLPKFLNPAVHHRCFSSTPVFRADEKVGASQVAPARPEAGETEESLDEQADQHWRMFILSYRGGFFWLICKCRERRV